MISAHTEPVVESGMNKMLWGFNIPTDQPIKKEKIRFGKSLTDLPDHAM